MSRAVFTGVLFALGAVCVSPAAAQYKIEEAFPNLRFERPSDFANDGLGFLYLAEQAGRIYRFPNDTTTSDTTAFLDIRDRVVFEVAPGVFEQESGLLGLIFHPDYDQNGYFYTYYITDDPLRSVLSRWERSADNPERADPESELVLLEVEQPTTRHNAGDLSFGTYGYLYVALGDGSTGRDQFENAQNPATLLGSILRIDVDKPDEGMNYGIPDDNPFAGNMQGHREEIYAYGLRNPWRFSIDPATGHLWVGDVGEQTWEEVSFVVNGGNYGWPIMEGPVCFDPPANCSDEGLYPPVWSYDHSMGRAIIGGFVYRGSRVPELKGKYLFAEWQKDFSQLWALSYEGNPYENPDAVAVDHVLDPIRFISSFGVDETGELYMLFTFEGRIMRFASSEGANADNPQPPTFEFELIGPNPFSEFTKVSFSFGTPTDATISVYDTIGRRVRTLFNGFVPAGALREAVFEAGSLPNGVYFIRLESDTGVRTIKTVLLD